jgi:hypothetical protein
MVKVYPKKDIKNEVEFKEWMRVVHNLVERTPIPDSYAFYRAIRSIEEMIDYSSEILDYLKDSDNEISFYSDRQVQEERIKAELIQNSVVWELIINEAEQDSYYKGEIAFLLEFSGILKYYEKNGNSGWSKSDNKDYLDEFEDYKEKALAVSPYMSKGKGEEQKNYDFLFERAVLTEGDYLLKHTASRKNLLSTDSKKNRNTRWKDLLRLSALDIGKTKKKRRGYIKELFDDKSFEFKNLEESLKNICDNYSGNDWRNLLINNPKLIDYCNQGYLAFRGEEGKEEIYLYKESQSNHIHRELYSYSFYLDHLFAKEDSVREDFMPFQKARYHSVKSRSDDPCAVLDNWEKEDNNYAVDIRYLSDSQEYELRFFNRKSSEVDNKIADILSYMGFEKADKTKETNCFYFNRFKSDDETIKKLKSLCSELNKLDL